MIPRVLVVEDEPHIRELVCLHLGHEGYACEGIGDGKDALKRAEAERFDLLVLDLMIPGLDGVSLTRAVRNGRTNHDVPILVITARRAESDKVLGLESGADDYLTKPFGVRELVARARALLRRPRLSPEIAAEGAPRLGGEAAIRHDQSAAAPAGAGFTPELGGPVLVHGIEIDPSRRRVRIDGQNVDLTDQEFRLLYLLATHAGIVFSREALLAKIWRGDTFVTVRSVDTLVKRLRRRIERDPSEPTLLLTVWGVGYKLADV
jgi:two-component system OmpR family response regulator/two-component system alkaline phosphatase synthesis response regulator PhoP